MHLPSILTKYLKSLSYGICAGVFCFSPLLFTGSTPITLLEKIEDQGYLQILSTNGSATVYEGPFGYAGFEYELASAFAEYLNVELSVSTVDPQDILTELNPRSPHFAAASLPLQRQEVLPVQYTAPYTKSSYEVIYQRGKTKPRKIGDILDRDIAVSANTPLIEQLYTLSLDYPELRWYEVEGDVTDLIEMVHNGEAEIAIVDSINFLTDSLLFPKARFGFDLNIQEYIAWAFPKYQDSTLLKAANTFLALEETQHKIAELEIKYFSRRVVDEGSALAFAERIEKRLPQWVDFFQTAADNYELDWLFLAAMSYQESLWNANAKSFTGVRGLMMLTNKTAKDLGITDRTDPEQSIHGGARYFVQIRNRIPKDIEEPDRTWMALAAYNVGLGHLEDARVITESQGGDPDLWDDVKERLPLLAKRAYFSKTKHGYARGWEPVTYVENIRNYHNILVWHYDNLERQLLAEVENDNLEIEDVEGEGDVIAEEAIVSTESTEKVTSTD